MKNMFLVILSFILMIVFSVWDDKKSKVYDCGMAEWHPDIPAAVKEECRRLHYEEWKKKNGHKYTT